MLDLVLMEPADLTIQILQGIRDEVRGTNARLDQVNARVDQTNARLDELRTELSDRIDRTGTRIDDLREELGRRIVESEVRTATAITALAGSVRDLADMLRAQHDLRPRVDKCERDIEALKKKRTSRKGA
jgi:chromosome segregation ATPase